MRLVRFYRSCLQYRVCAVPLGASLIFILAAGAFYALFVHCEWGFAGCDSVNLDGLLRRFTINTDVPMQYASRLTWASALGLHMAVCLGAVIAGAFIIRNTLQDYPPRTKQTALALAIFFAAAGSTILALSNYQAVILQLLDRTVATDLRNVIFLTRLIDGLSFFTAIFLAAVSGTTLVPRPDCEAQSAVGLALQVKQLRMVLYVGAAVLVFGVVQVSGLYNWSLNFLRAPEPDNGLTKSVESLVSSLVNTRGIYYTLFLAIIFIPAAVILRSRAHDLAARTFPEKSLPERDEWLRTQGLSLSFFEALPRFSIILGPLLSGPIGELIKYFR